MPQLSPMSWSVIGFTVMCYFLVVCVTLWWVGTGQYSTGSQLKGKVAVSSRGFGFASAKPAG
uniref:ATP synthase F0 subunit 8 n=1 Tax=Pseudunio marocanus TaxID=518768 RepID=A0A1W5XF43_9BIVA|nr:ATP synthase F0 subunit 8 [Pseudunio marocanus]